MSEAARRKGVSRQAIHYLIDKGKLEAVAQTVEKVEWKVCPKSLAKLKINPNMQGRNGRPPRKPSPRRYCPSCEASVTSTDEQAGYCTNCQQPLSTEVRFNK